MLLHRLLFFYYVLIFIPSVFAEIGEVLRQNVFFYLDNTICFVLC